MTYRARFVHLVSGLCFMGFAGWFLSTERTEVGLLFFLCGVLQVLVARWATTPIPGYDDIGDD